MQEVSLSIMADSTHKLFMPITLKVEDVYPDPEQPRSEMTNIDALAANIDRYGLLHPILVRRTGNVYRIIGGERRWTAVRSLGHETIDAYVAETDDAEVALLELADNMHEPLTETDRSRGVQRVFSFDLDNDADVSKATGVPLLALTAARQGFARVKDPAATETLSLARLSAIAEFEDEETVSALLTAPEDRWKADYARFKADRKRAAEVVAASAIVDAAGVELLSGGWPDSSAYAYIGSTGFEPGTAAPEGAVAAFIRAYGKVDISWYGAASGDEKEAQRSAEREARDAVRQQLEEAADKRLAFILASFQVAPGMKRLAEDAWECGVTANAHTLREVDADVNGLTTRMVASVLVSIAGTLEGLLQHEDGVPSWSIMRRQAPHAVRLSAELTRAGYAPSELERARFANVKTAYDAFTKSEAAAEQDEDREEEDDGDDE